MWRTNWFLRPVTLGALALSIAACGGSSKSGKAPTGSHRSPKTTSTQGASAPSTTSTQGASASSGGRARASVTTGPVRATLTGQNHSPVVNKRWTYTVTVADAAGRPLDGTALSEFAFGGQVVGHETPRTHRLRNGRLTDAIEYPARTAGVPVTFQIVIHTRRGIVTLQWPIKVRR